MASSSRLAECKNYYFQSFYLAVALIFDNDDDRFWVIVDLDFLIASGRLGLAKRQLHGSPFLLHRNSHPFKPASAATTVPEHPIGT
jgi:hypothetical protein